MLLIRKQLGTAILIVACFVNTSFAQGIDNVKAEIYSKLHCCVCRDSFMQCVCPEAKEMKAYVEALLETGVGKEEIYYKVAKKYSLNAITDGQIKAGIGKRFIDEAGGKRPQLVLETHSFDFGRLQKAQGVVKKIFAISNKGTDTLVINNIKTSCGCVKASLRRSVIEPGKTGELEVAIDLQHASLRTGKLIREVRIVSNDPLYPETVITVEGEVKE
jgi:hypothetical protein